MLFSRPFGFARSAATPRAAAAPTPRSAAVELPDAPAELDPSPDVVGGSAAGAGSVCGTIFVTDTMPFVLGSRVRRLSSRF
jgi:hypothetical protein